MTVPVRPTPALQCTSSGPLQRQRSSPQTETKLTRMYNTPEDLRARRASGAHFPQNIDGGGGAIWDAVIGPGDVVELPDNSRLCAELQRERADNVVREHLLGRQHQRQAVGQLHFGPQLRWPRK